MPTIMTHAFVPLAVGIALGRRAVPSRLLIAGAVAAMLPDADVVAFKLGIAYAADFGHRGASHSLLFALLVGAFGAFAHRSLGTTRWRAMAWLAACTASHPLLDALTNGGLGVALFWPWSDARLFAPWTPIRVSPIGAAFFSQRGVMVLLSEARWVWAPTLVAAGLLTTMRMVWRRNPPFTPGDSQTDRA